MLVHQRVDHLSVSMVGVPRASFHEVKIGWAATKTWTCLVVWNMNGSWLSIQYHSVPIGSMYGIYANIGGILMVNVTIYSIHGSYGVGNVIIPTDFHIFQRGWNHQPVTLWFVSKRSCDLCKGFWTTRVCCLVRLWLEDWHFTTPESGDRYQLPSTLAVSYLSLSLFGNLVYPIPILWGRLSMDRMRYTYTILKRLKATFYFDLFWMKLWTPILMSTKQFFVRKSALIWPGFTTV